MRYVTSVERFGIEEGMKQGLERLLIRRFGKLPTWAKELLNGATLEQLACWLDRVMDAPRLEDVLAAP